MRARSMPKESRVSAASKSMHPGSGFGGGAGAGPDMHFETFSWGPGGGQQRGARGGRGGFGGIDEILKR